MEIRKYTRIKDGLSCKVLELCPIIYKRNKYLLQIGVYGDGSCYNDVYKLNNHDKKRHYVGSAILSQKEKQWVKDIARLRGFNLQCRVEELAYKIIPAVEMTYGDGVVRVNKHDTTIVRISIVPATQWDGRIA